MIHSIIAMAPRDKELDAWRVVIETPRGSGAKYDYDPECGLFQLAHILPEGFVFPHAFGFIPSTVGDDGDPLDVLLMTEEEMFCGCVVPSRVIGVIEGEQVEGGDKSIRNDRFIALPVKSRRFTTIHSAKDLPKQQVDDIRDFFEHYNHELGRTFKVIKWAGPAAARKLLERGVRRYRRHEKRR